VIGVWGSRCSADAHWKGVQSRSVCFLCIEKCRSALGAELLTTPSHPLGMVSSSTPNATDHRSDPQMGGVCKRSEQVPAASLSCSLVRLPRARARFILTHARTLNLTILVLRSRPRNAATQRHPQASAPHSASVLRGFAFCQGTKECLQRSRGPGPSLSPPICGSDRRSVVLGVRTVLGPSVGEGLSTVLAPNTLRHFSI